MSEYTIRKSNICPATSIIIGVLASTKPVSDLVVNIIEDDGIALPGEITPTENYCDFADEEIGDFGSVHAYCVHEITQQRRGELTEEQEQRIDKWVDELFWTTSCLAFHPEYEGEDWSLPGCSQALKKAHEAAAKVTEENFLTAVRLYRKAFISCVKKALSRLDIAEKHHFDGVLDRCALSWGPPANTEEVELYLACNGAYDEAPLIVYIDEGLDQAKFIPLKRRNILSEEVPNQTVFETTRALLAFLAEQFETQLIDDTLCLPLDDANAAIDTLNSVLEKLYGARRSRKQSAAVIA